MRQRLSTFTLALLLAVSAQAQTVNYTGTGNCVDDRDGDISDLVSWSSDMQGALGVGSPLQFDLNEGTHIVTAVCADAAGNQATASQSVTVVIEDTTPPSLSITVEPTVAQAGISVTPTDALAGLWSLRLDPKQDGSAAYVGMDEGLASPNGHVVEDWGTGVDARVTIRHRDAVLADGFEMVVMRGSDAEEAPLFDLILTGTQSEPQAMARVYDSQGPLTTPPVTLLQTENRFKVEWMQSATVGLVRLTVNAAPGGEILNLNTDREMTRFLLGAPVTTVGLGGYLMFDAVEVFQL